MEEDGGTVIASRVGGESEARKIAEDYSVCNFIATINNVAEKTSKTKFSQLPEPGTWLLSYILRQCCSSHMRVCNSRQ